MACSLMSLWDNAKKVAFAEENVVPYLCRLKDYRTF